jgi:5-dehydro-2-deoxygluconokinase
LSENKEDTSGSSPHNVTLDSVSNIHGFGVSTGEVTPSRNSTQKRWASDRIRNWPELRVFAFDCRLQLATTENAESARIDAFEKLCVAAIVEVAEGKNEFGILCDDPYGTGAIDASFGGDLWIGRSAAIAKSGRTTLDTTLGENFEGLVEWPLNHVVKVQCHSPFADNKETWVEQIAQLKKAFSSSRTEQLEFMLEIVYPHHGNFEEQTIVNTIQDSYDAGIFPDWWLLEPMKTRDQWQEVCDAIVSNDPHTRGILISANDASQNELSLCLANFTQSSLIKGFSVGREFSCDLAHNWLANAITDQEVIEDIVSYFSGHCDAWARAKRQSP